MLLTRTIHASLLTGVAACAPGPLVLEIPFEQADRAAIIAVVTEEGAQVYGVDGAYRQTQPILQSIAEWDGTARIEVHALYYRSELDSLNVPVGKLFTEPEGEMLPTEDRRLSAVLEDGEDVVWVETQQRAPVLEDFRLPRNTSCQTLASDPDRFDLEEGALPLALGRGPQGDLWVVSVISLDSEAVIQRVTATGLEAPIDLDLPLRIRAALVTEAGEFWLAGGEFGDGALIYRGNPRDGFVRAGVQPNVVSSRWPHHLVAPRPGAGEGSDIMYTLAPTGRLSRLDEVDWPVLADLEGAGVVGALAYNGPEDLFVARPDGQVLLRYRSSGVTREDTAVDSALLAMADRLESLAVIPGLGAFAGTDGGILLERTDEGWTVAEQNSLVQSSIEAMVPYRTGMVVVGRYGIVDQYYPGEGYCVPERVFVGTNTTLDHVLVTEAGLLVAGDERLEGRQNRGFVAWVRPAPQ